MGSILEHYDSDSNFPVLGFGGRPHLGAAANHCFSVNRNEVNPEVHGISAILDVYRCGREIGRYVLGSEMLLLLLLGSGFVLDVKKCSVYSRIR